MNTYDKEAFMAGYRAALALRGIKPSMSVMPGVRQLYMHEGYQVIWYNDHKFTITWTVDDQGGQGVILYPNLYPVKLTGKVIYSSGRANIQFGECTIKGTMPTVISTGANRNWYENSIPVGRLISNQYEYLDSVFFGEVYSSPGSILSMTVETKLSEVVYWFLWEDITQNRLNIILFSDSSKYLKGQSYELIDSLGDRKMSWGISSSFNQYAGDVFWTNTLMKYRPDGYVAFRGTSEELIDGLTDGSIFTKATIYNCDQWYPTTEYVSFDISSEIEETGLITMFRMM